MASTQSRSSDAKIALITGASGGIGRATALALSRAGYRVIGTSETLLQMKLVKTSRCSDAM